MKNDDLRKKGRETTESEREKSGEVEMKGFFLFFFNRTGLIGTL